MAVALEAGADLDNLEAAPICSMAILVILSIPAAEEAPTRVLLEVAVEESC